MDFFPYNIASLQSKLNSIVEWISMTIMENLGNQLQELRRKKGLSQEALAEQSGYSTATISRMESGKALTMPVLECVTEVLDAQISIQPNGDYVAPPLNDTNDVVMEAISKKVVADIIRKLTS